MDNVKNIEILPKLWNIIVWVMFLLMVILFSCHSSTLVSKRIHYDLVDIRGNLHRYSEDVHGFKFPKDNEKLTQYCVIDHRWEDIKAVYRKVDGLHQWKYRVNANKKN